MKNLKRENRIRFKLKKVTNRKRLSVFKSNNHIYAQIINDEKGVTIASASSLEKDLRNAKIYYSTFGDEEKRKKTHFALKSATQFIKGELGKVLQFPVVPNLRFIFDDSLEKGSEIVDKINKLNTHE